jgi:hypothetical protein
MDFHNFDLEYFQSQFERTVEINLADSFVKCANVSDLLAGEDTQPLLELPLYYPEVNGTTLLRERIAALYPNASAANVLVTVGAAQVKRLIRHHTRRLRKLGCWLQQTTKNSGSPMQHQRLT